MKTTSFLLAMLLSSGLSLIATRASAQDDPAAAPPSSPPSSKAKQGAEPPPIVSLALERFGGLAYAKASEKDGDDSVSLFTMGLGVGTVNPYAVPRIGVDYVLPFGLSLGASAGIMRWSGSASSGSRSEDIGSVFLYTLTPRVGYRIPLSERIDFTPRAGMTFAGASLSSGTDDTSASVFSVGVGADAPFAFRVTDSFNLLAGPAFDMTVSATTSATSTSTTSGSGGSSSSTSTSDVKGTLWSVQGWVGVGGYL